MNSRGQSLLFGDTPKERGKLLSLLLAKRSAQGSIVLPSDAANLIERLSALSGDVERVAAAVLGRVTSLDKTALLQLIDQNDQPAGQDAEDRSEGLLGQTRACAEHAEDPRVRRREPKRGQPFRELGRGVGAHLGNQEGG